MQHCSGHIITPESSAIMQTRSNFESRKSLPPASLLASDKTPNTDSASVFGAAWSLLERP